MKKKFPDRRKGTRREKRTDRELANRVRKLRGALTQEDFAKLLGVKQSAVSAWEQGRPAPSAENYVRLGNKALPYEDIAWFWQRAGVDVNVFEHAADELLKKRSALVDSLDVKSIDEGSTESLLFLLRLFRTHCRRALRVCTRTTCRTSDLATSF